MADRSAVPKGQLLRIYLRDHHAAGRAGAQLARRTARAHGGDDGRVLAAVADEVAHDLGTLEGIMRRLDVSPSAVKVPLAVLAERLGRLKLNGRLLERSPLSSVIELEALQAGITAKRSLWHALGRIAAGERRLADLDFGALVRAAEDQRARVEAVCAHDIQAAFGAGGEQRTVHAP